MIYVQGIFGIAVMIGIAWGVSENRRGVNWRVIAVSLIVQFILALALLKVPFVRSLFQYLNDAVLALQAATAQGTQFVFGYLAGGDMPFAVTNAGANFILAFQALPLVLVLGGLSALLWHWRVLPVIVNGFAWALKRTLGVGGAVGVTAAANIFVGMVEAPLLVRPYIARLTRSEMFVVMTVGMATIAGTMMILYSTAISSIVPDAVAHLLIASIISAPAAIMIALVMVPSKAGEDGTEGEPEVKYASSMEAITRGTQEGLNLFLYIIAMLVAFVALVALVNSILGVLPDVGGAPITLERLLGLVMAPFVWLMGIPWHEAHVAGQLMGVKVVLNEYLAYLQMAALPDGSLSARSELIMAYALCGFANFGSLGIMLAGLIAMAPERRAEIAGLGMKSLLSGVLATSITGAIVGLM